MVSRQTDFYNFLFLILECLRSAWAQQTDSVDYSDDSQAGVDQNELVYDFVVGFGGLAVGIISIMILIICLCSKKGKGTKKLTPEEDEKQKRREARSEKRTEKQKQALMKSHFQQFTKMDKPTDS